MRDVGLRLNPLDFETLAELGRSVIPSAAPGWTDHNAHDPGIMLLELISWIAEAQMYGIARTRKDERLAFARLLGLTPRGPVPATGLLWADATATAPPPWPAGYVVGRGTRVTPGRANVPAFFTTESVELITAALARVFTTFADGRTSDWTSVNRPDGATFMPFGDSAGPGDRLVIQFAGPLTGGGMDTTISIGIHVVAPRAGRDMTPGADRSACDGTTSRLAVTLRDEEGERPLRILRDTTRGLLQAGVLLLQVPTRIAGQRPAVVLRSVTGGFLRSPRVQQVAANVLPIEQAEHVGPEVAALSSGRPDQEYALKQGVLMSPCAARPLVVTLHGANGAEAWTRVRDFEVSGPADSHYVLAEAGAGAVGIIRFGNGIDGKTPSAGDALEVEYWVSAGSLGNQPANLAWSVAGLGGVFGSNPLPIEGGEDARALPDLRRLARQRVLSARPIVTSADLVAAALAFSDLGLTRARELPLSGKGVPGTRVLVVVGPGSEIGTAAPSSEEMLAEVRARLAPRLPLGQHLEVMPPRYAVIRIHATIVAAPRWDPGDLRDAIVATLRSRFDVAPPGGQAGWPFGREVAAAAIAGWIKKVEGVSRVAALTVESDGKPAPGGVVPLTDAGLPLLDIPNCTVSVQRAPAGAAR